MTSGPNAAPKPAHANDTMPNTELFGSRAMITPSTAINTTVIRAISMPFFAEIFRWKVSCKMFSDTLDAAANSWESAVDMVLAKMPAKINPAMMAKNTPF